MKPTQSKARHNAARKAARARWGPQRVVRLDQVDPDTRRLILALLAQDRQPASQEERAA